jgi:pre-mRNA-processing factor 6
MNIDHMSSPVLNCCAFHPLQLQKGCDFCPTSDDIWLEASRMQANPDSAKAVLARGVAALPNSIKLWLQV